MPWKETCRMDEKLVFVADCLRGELPMTALCEDYGISRKTGYKWLGRYREHGPEGLVERSRCAAPSWSVDGAGDGRSDCCSAPAASPLGSAQAARSADGRAPRGGVACGQHDGRSAACGRAGGLPPTAPSRGRTRPAVPHRHRTQRCLVHRLQGLVPHPRRRTLRPLDRQRRPQPFPAGLRHRPAPDPRSVWRSSSSSSATACLWPSARTTRHRSPERARADCLVCRSAGSRPASRWSVSSPASPSRTGGTSACIGP